MRVGGDNEKPFRTVGLLLFFEDRGRGRGRVSRAPPPLRSDMTAEKR